MEIHLKNKHFHKKYLKKNRQKTHTVESYDDRWKVSGEEEEERRKKNVLS